uniref:Protein Vpu n=1 Tax=Human immunodeficiency virus type 1 TaxID=11676 RepID=A0A076V5C3_HV1|nr:vpu protein [Human immunodeficiency virus 1]
MQPLVIVSIVALVIVAIIAIVVWTIVLLKYKKILKQKKINKLLNKIQNRAKDSGNESKGDQKKLSALKKMEHHAPWNVNNL